MATKRSRPKKSIRITVPKKPKKNKFALYENSVQSPETHAKWFVDTYKELRGKYPRHLREDFCGTFQLATHWVCRNQNNTAEGLDIDAEPLRYAQKHHWPLLNASQKKRLSVIQQNVFSVSETKADIICACNFSFFVIQKRKDLVDYFRFCLRSLKADGILILEMAGGPGMMEVTKESKVVYSNGKRAFTYIWDQKSFDPIHQRGKYAIHFRFSNRDVMHDAFTYDWRLWTVPEIREALEDAGFKRTYVYWETEHMGEPTGEFIRSEVGDNAYAWIAHVVGSKK